MGDMLCMSSSQLSQYLIIVIAVQIFDRHVQHLNTCTYLCVTGESMSVDDVMTVECDVLVPSALGGVIDEHMAAKVRFIGAATVELYTFLRQLLRSDVYLSCAASP